MAEEKFAFESAEVSLAMFLGMGLGDCLVPKKILDAFVELEPRCSVDIFCATSWNLSFVPSFYAGDPNVNLIRGKEFFSEDFAQKYDLILRPHGTFAIFVDKFDAQRLKAKSPVLYECVSKINAYNEKNIKPFQSSYISVALHNLDMARVLGKNLNYFLSCDGALPIRDDSVPYVSLSPKFESQFNDLKLDKYITVYSSIPEKEEVIPKIKTYSIENLAEYVGLVKEHLPQIKVVQCGGGGSAKIAGADHYFLGVDMELTKYILANSLLNVGCEGGLAHLATALGTKCLVLFSSTSIYCHGYKNNINLAPNLVCSPCVYIWEGGAAETCPRGYKDPPCRVNVTPKQIFEETYNYLHSLDKNLEYRLPYLQKKIEISRDYLNHLE